MSNYSRIKFERVRRVTDPPFEAARERLNRCYYGDRRWEWATVIVRPAILDADGKEIVSAITRQEQQPANTHLRSFGTTGKHYWANGWQSGVSHPFPGKDGIVYDVVPGDPSRTRSIDLQGRVTLLAMTAKQLFERLQSALDEQLTQARAAYHDTLPVQERYADLDRESTDVNGQPRTVSKRAASAVRLEALKAAGIEVEVVR